MSIAHIVHVAFPTLDYFHVGLEGMRELTGDEPGALLKAADQDLGAAFVAAISGEYFALWAEFLEHCVPSSRIDF